MKRSVKRGSLHVLILVLVIALLITGFSFVRSLLVMSDEAFVSIAISGLESIGLLVSVLIAVRQLNDSKEISRASFIVELNRTFTESKGNVELYTALQDCRDGKCASGGECAAKGTCLLTFPKVVVSNYLTFFETIYLLEKNGAISFEMIDDLFAYRFFLAVHSQFVQQEKLAPQPENFKNIFCLEYEWIQYREKVAHKIDAENSVFKTRPLKDLMVTDSQKQIYDGWIKECKRFR